VDEEEEGAEGLQQQPPLQVNALDFVLTCRVVPASAVLALSLVVFIEPALKETGFSLKAPSGINALMLSLAKGCQKMN